MSSFLSPFMAYWAHIQWKQLKTMRKLDILFLLSLTSEGWRDELSDAYYFRGKFDKSRSLGLS